MSEKNKPDLADIAFARMFTAGAVLIVVLTIMAVLGIIEVFVEGSYADGIDKSDCECRDRGSEGT